MTKASVIEARSLPVTDWQRYDQERDKAHIQLIYCKKFQDQITVRCYCFYAYL